MTCWYPEVKPSLTPVVTDGWQSELLWRASVYESAVLKPQLTGIVVISASHRKRFSGYAVQKMFEKQDLQLKFHTIFLDFSWLYSLIVFHAYGFKGKDMQSNLCNLLRHQ